MRNPASEILTTGFSARMHNLPPSPIFNRPEPEAAGRKAPVSGDGRLGSWMDPTPSALRQPPLLDDSRLTTCEARNSSKP
jgi:hypothetical protein